MSDGLVVAAVMRDLEDLPGGMGASALAATALALAAEIDGDNSATSKSMCAKALLDVLNRLRELAPPELARDGIDELADQRDIRRTSARKVGP